MPPRPAQFVVAGVIRDADDKALAFQAAKGSGDIAPPTGHLPQHGDLLGSVTQHRQDVGLVLVHVGSVAVERARPCPT